MGANKREYLQIIPPPRQWTVVKIRNFLRLMFLYLSCFIIHFAESIWHVIKEEVMLIKLIQNQGVCPDTKKV